MCRSYTFSITTALRAPASRVWAHASTFVGVNRELWPLARMTYPPALDRLTPERVPLGRCAFRSWILLFGLVPVDFDDIALVELEPGRGFLEVSRMFSMREWRHRRTVLPTAAGCVIRDEITGVPRWPRTGSLSFGVFRLTFRLRHRNLIRLFGRAAPAEPQTCERGS